MKKLLFGMAFFMGAMMFSIGSLEAREEEDCEMTQECSDAGCSILNAKKLFLQNGCKQTCQYTCFVQPIPIPG